MIKSQEILQAFHFRHACKLFDPAKKIRGEDFDCILEAGRLSPSSFGFEPWQFLVIQNQELREKLLPYIPGGQKQIPTASHVLIAVTRHGPSMHPGSDYLTHLMSNELNLPAEAVKGRGDFFGLFQEKLVHIAGDERKIADWAAKQAYIPLGNMMTVAAMLGIDSCPIEGLMQNELEAELAREAGLDLSTYRVAYVVAFGYRQTEPRASQRRSMDEVVRWYR